MNQIDLQNIKSKLKLYIARHPKMYDIALADLFLEENEDIPLKVRSIRRYISLVKKAEEDLDEDILELDEDSLDTIEIDDTKTEAVTPCLSTDELEEEDKVEDPAYEERDVEEDYMFELKRGGITHKVDRVTVDIVICAYSRQGLNLTTGLIQSILDISPDIVKAIIYNLNINKESKPYSQYSEDNLEASDLYNELNDNLSYLLDRWKENDGTTITKLNKVYKKSILLEQQKDLKFKALVSDLVNKLPKVSFDSMESSSIEDLQEDGYDHSHIFIPDMHIGLEQDNYNTDIIRKQLEYILTFIEEAPNVHVHFMGDIIHSVSGLNHRDTWKNMDPSSTGAEAIIQPYKLLVEFLSTIENLHSVNIVGGNHDRISSNRSEENTGEGAKLIAFMLQETLEDIPVNFDSFRIVDNEDPKMTVILLHGDKPVDKEPGQSIAWTYGNPDKFNYIMTAHMHSRKQMPKDDGLTFRKEALPAFCPSDNYAKTVAHGSLPGFKLVSAGSNKLPLVMDIPLHYDA